VKPMGETTASEPTTAIGQEVRRMRERLEAAEAVCLIMEKLVPKPGPTNPHPWGNQESKFSVSLEGVRALDRWRQVAGREVNDAE
jgi:hypothetical protein